MSNQADPRPPLAGKTPPSDLAAFKPDDDDWGDPPEEGRGGPGCAWGAFLAALGCVTIPLAMLAVVVLMGLNTVGGVLDGVRSIFNPPPPVYNFYAPNLVLERVQNLAQLTTTRYSFSNIVTSERELPTILSALYRDRLTMVIAGHVNAGVNLARMTEADVYTEGDTLVLRLPAPEILDCFLNEPASYVISRETGLFASPAPELDIASRRFAVRQFRDAALEQGILEDVNTQARQVLEQMLGTLAPADAIQPVRVVTTPPDPAAPLPSTCQ